MSPMNPADRLEEQVSRWRAHVQAQGRPAGAIAAVEDRLRAELAMLLGAGLSEDEAVLVAAKRVGRDDVATHAFAREESERAWQQPPPAPRGIASPQAWREAAVAFGLAVLAALAIKAPELFGLRLDAHPGFYARNLGLLVLPMLAAYFAWKRGARAAVWVGLAAAFAVAAAFANAYAFSPGTEVLTAIHLPIALWLAIGVAYAGGRWNELAVRMDVVRFSGELFVHYVLIALGGAVLVALMMGLFAAIGLDMEWFLERWMLPCGAAGAVLVGAWLVEGRQGVSGSLAPMLVRLFTPLFTAVLLALLATMAWTGRALEFHRDLLIAFDLLLVVVFALVLFAIASRDPRRPPGALDVLQVVLLGAALLVDAMALWTIAARIGELGFTPNRVAVLGENLILLVNLAGSVVLYLRFLRGRATFGALERWQTRYLPVYAAWAAFVVVAFPPLFR